ncbi:MAG: hypothetical protein JWQ34_370 [Mucilaginibacter sp.]|uniref:hypothetical protein n=1 Tax=Mucilaginibacter sp. TaxID=1882438 RepID=UPI0026337B35|nr:hypothetical protein [Mucilaginibacter sp.]MDB5002145.1 hypothetical protein [Mucilaginibacter sp.]
MLRIYLDTNLLTKIDKFPQLKEKLSEHSDYLNLVYSSAHIDDLSRSSNDELIKQDLKQIKDYTEDQCLAKYWGEEKLRYDIRDPFEFFDTCKETAVEISNPFDMFAQECEKLGIENPLDRLNNLNHLLDVDTSLPELDNFPFEAFKREKNFKSLLEDITGFVKESLISNTPLKTTRKNIDGQLSRKAIANVKGNIIDYLNRELPKTAYNKTFDELVIDSLKIRFNDKPYSHFDWFITAYNTLDLFGYKADNNSSTSNIVTDAFHAYYAAHCDIFLTEDKRLRDKARVLYEDGRFDTLILSENEFCDQVDSLISKIKDSKSLSNLINYINTLEFEYYYSDVASKATIAEYYINTFFAGYFNYAIWLSSMDGINFISFIKQNNTLSNWYYFKELKSLLKNFVEWLGPDLNNNAGFINHTVEFPENDIWIGRKWFIGELALSLSQEKEFGFMFRVQTTKE